MKDATNDFLILGLGFMMLIIWSVKELNIDHCYLVSLC